MHRRDKDGYHYVAFFIFAIISKAENRNCLNEIIIGCNKLSWSVREKTM